MRARDVEGIGIGRGWDWDWEGSVGLEEGGRREPRVGSASSAAREGKSKSATSGAEVPLVTAQVPRLLIVSLTVSTVSFTVCHPLFLVVGHLLDVPLLPLFTPYTPRSLPSLPSNKMFSLALLALLVVKATAQVPSSISNTCASYLTSLNTDSALSSCIQPLLSAASSFSPSSSSSTSQLSSTLTTLCSASPCSDTVIRSHLTNFYSSCQPELTASNTTSGTAGTAYAEVRQFYDVLYVINPLRSAVCSKDNSTGAWCVEEIAHDNAVAGNNTGGAGGVVNAAVAPSEQDKAIQLAQDYLYISAPTLVKRADSTSTTSAPLSTPSPLAGDNNILPNSTTYGSTNLAFLFLLPSLSSNLLCTSCTRTLLTSYIKWESSVPYALGLSNSQILGGQAALWNGVSATCGTGFVGDVEQGAGTVLGGSLSGALPLLSPEWAKAIAGVVAGLAALLAL
ncbi:hypothetical protein DACRYDRAFT_95220 [Dacryopinax primogenitus]|uniref:Uncharacterized protein n=1 Tax=Dacryopinax primogenitus (strain DJM 731) TaxID=1858805 RepID=M5GAI1_DACPD|nr:uncharacterized protein DACRYDRAFT_95220 [Dacryopinax primogenitus]EJU00923.1 hypothetical protein DACRYDRAFT_95220 [Dacryopinax primogenitus]